MIKAVFFDIDGTLVPFATGTCSPSAVRAVRELQSRGVLCFVATGRSRFEIATEHLLDGLQFDGYLTNNGQDAYDAQWKQIYGKPLDPQDVQALLDWTDRKGYTCWLANAEKTCINHSSPEFLRAMEAVHTRPLFVGDLREMSRQPIYKLVLFARPEEMTEPCRLAPHSRTTQWFELGHDFISADGDKENALREIMRLYRLRPEETMAFGDSENDASMLRTAGIGVAMGNATPEALASADYVTDDAEKDGIYNALRHFGII